MATTTSEALTILCACWVTLRDMEVRTDPPASIKGTLRAASVRGALQQSIRGVLQQKVEEGEVDPEVAELIQRVLEVTAP